MNFNSQIDAGPGLSSEVSTDPRTIVYGDGADARFIPGGRTIDGTASRDPGNTGDVDTLRAGLVLGKITSSGKYAPSIIGPSGTAYASGTTLNVTAATAVEIVRRQGATGTFKITGPPTAAGTVRTKTVTYSAVDTTTGDVTITALPAASVWTLTAPAGQDGGMYQLEVTTPDGVIATTTALAANANTATVDAALEALVNVGTGGVAAVYSDPTLTLTFLATLGAVKVRVLSDTTNDGGAFEGGWAAVETTVGVDGRFVAASLVQPTDGSETPIVLLDSEYGVKVTDSSGTSRDANGARLMYAGSINVSQVINYPADASTQAWLKARLNGNLASTITAATANTAGRLTFSDRF